MVRRLLMPLVMTNRPLTLVLALIPAVAGAATARSPEQRDALATARRIVKKAAATRQTPEQMRQRAAALRAGAGPKQARVRQLEDDVLNARSANPKLDAGMAELLQAEA